MAIVTTPGPQLQAASSWPIVIFARNDELAWQAAAKAYCESRYPGQRAVIRTTAYHKKSDLERCRRVILRDLTSENHAEIAADYRAAGCIVETPGQAPLAPTLIPSAIKPLPPFPIGDAKPMSQRLAEQAEKTQRAEVDWSSMSRQELDIECEARGVEVVGTGIRGYKKQSDYLKALGVKA